MRRRHWLQFGAAWCSPFAWAQVYAQSGPGDQITLTEARRMHLAGAATLIDIREADEHATGVAAGAKLLPMSQLGQRLSEISASPDLPVLLICRTQNRSSATLAALRKQFGEQKFANVRFVQGGMSQWAQQNWPMVLPAKP